METHSYSDPGTIIVATDFSKASLNAAAYAADLAVTAKKDLLLLHIVVLQVAFSEASLNLNIDELNRDAQQELDQLKDDLRCRAKGKLCINTLIRTGTFFNELKTACDNIHPYLVVMGSQGTTVTERFVFGGHTVYAMKHLPWSLITVPLYVDKADIHNIGLACDFHNVADKLPAEALAKFSEIFQAKLHVLNVRHKGTNQQQVQQEHAQLEQKLQAAHPEYHFVENDNIDAAIIEFASKQHLDLLVVLPKKHNILEMLTQKSHTRELVLKSHVPVMTIGVEAK